VNSTVAGVVIDVISRNGQECNFGGWLKLGATQQPYYLAGHDDDELNMYI